jgi:chemotaxis protein methyltransferase CheR
MSAAAPAPAASLPHSETRACQYIIDLIYERSGIRLHEGKEALIRARLGKRVRHLGLTGLAQYCEYLQTQGSDEEFVRVVDALTTNFTSFLREESHFKYLVEEALPSLAPNATTKIRIWSAASSSGEEPYSIALYLAEHFPTAQGWDWHVTASDISVRILEAAQAGIYSEERVSSLPKEWLRGYFQKGVGEWAGHYRVKKNLSGRVQFSQINLIDSYSHPHLFQVIFCRNVMIYFDRPTQERLIQHLARFLVPKGILLIGHSESLNGLNVPLQCLAPSIYRRT